MSASEQVLRVGSLLEQKDLHLELLTGRHGLSRVIRGPLVQKPGLALAGYPESLHPDRVQVVGYSEITYIQSLPEHVAWRRVRDLCERDIPCIIITRGLDAPECLHTICRDTMLPLLSTTMPSLDFIEELKGLLWSRLSPSTSVHGVLVDVFGVGVLLLGLSGVGKSETALELVMHGHRLVADDIVDISRRDAHTLSGSGPELIRHHMEIRGLGILNIKDLFGIASVREAKKVELVAELVEWNSVEEYDRLGVDDLSYSILGIEIPLLRLPVRPGRNIAAIIEVAARNQLLKLQGHHSAREFQQRLIRAIETTRENVLVEGEVE